MVKNISIEHSNFYLKLKSFFIFFIFFLVIFFYRTVYPYDNLIILLLFHLLILAVFVISAYRIKTGFYIFIFLIPLLNSITTMLAVKNVNIILFLFFALLLGFIVNRYSLILGNNTLHVEAVRVFDRELAIVTILFIGIVFISSAITIYRYANFVPLITGRYHDLVVNLNGVRSTGSIYWTISFFFNYIVGFSLVYIAYSVFDRMGDIINAFITIIISNVIVILFGFYQFLFNPYLGNFSSWVDADRINSTLTDPNSLGNYIVIMFPVYISMIIYFKKWYLKIIAVILFLGFTVLGFLSGSRNALMGMVLALLIFFGLWISRIIKKTVKRIRRFNKRGPGKAGNTGNSVTSGNRSEQKKSSLNMNFSMHAVISAFLIVLVLCVMITSCDTGEVGLKELEKPQKTGVALVDRTIDTIWMAYNTYKRVGFIDSFKSISSFRSKLWYQAYNMFKDYPVTGVGLGGYIIQLPNYYEKYQEDTRHIDFTGNYYLQILSELGITGLIIILLLFFLIIRKTVLYYLNINRHEGTIKTGTKNQQAGRQYWLFTGFFISFIVMLVVLFFGPHTNFNEIQFSFYLIIALMLSFLKLEKNRYGINENQHIRSFSLFSGGCPGKDIKSYRMRIISFFVILAVFTGVFFAGSWTDLSINKGQVLYGWENNYGFYKYETVESKKIRWTDVDASEVLPGEGESLEFEVKAITPGITKIPVFVRFYYDNKLIKLMLLRDREWHDVILALPGMDKAPAKDRSDKFTFTISVSRGWVPAQWGMGSDTRNLGIMLTPLEFK